jgi:hypothetical protein
MDDLCAAGDYGITTEDEATGDFHRAGLPQDIHIPPPAGRPGIGQIVEIDPEELMVPVLKPSSL